MNRKNYSYLKKFIKSIEDGLLIPDPAKYLESANNIAIKFDSQLEWNDKLSLLDLLKEIYYTELAGIDAHAKMLLYSDRLKWVLNSGDDKKIVKIINKYRQNLVDLSREELLSSSALSDKIFSHMMKMYPDLRVELFTYNLSNNNNDMVLEWIKSNYDLIKKDILSYQEVILPMAVPGNDPIEVYCEMLTAMPVIKGSTEYNERVSRFEVLFSHNPGTSDNEILNIMNGFVWAKLEPTEQQKSTVKEKIKIKEDTWAEPNEFRSLRNKFYRLKN